MEENIIIEKIERVVRESATEQIDHLRRGRVERNFTTYLANKLKPIFEDGTITVDPFYNRHGDAAKRLNGSLIELDIAIHEQGVDHNNLVAIELETNNKPTRDDLWKIERLTKELDGYGYKLGLFVVSGINDKAGEVIAMEWYKNGKPL
ncbi:MAG: hypothetical protein L6Q29_02945 [Candidatus Pacebacteria bacterium]|nr:hypothetical protein [Candidatus Paceibacterota bacterium]